MTVGVVFSLSTNVSRLSVPSAAKRPRSVGSTVRQSSCYDGKLRSAKLLEQLADKGRLPDAGDAVHVHGRVLTLMDELL